MKTEIQSNVRFKNSSKLNGCKHCVHCLSMNIIKNILVERRAYNFINKDVIVKVLTLIIKEY